MLSAAKLRSKVASRERNPLKVLHSLLLLHFIPSKIHSTVREQNMGVTETLSCIKTLTLTGPTLCCLTQRCSKTTRLSVPRQSTGVDTTRRARRTTILKNFILFSFNTRAVCLDISNTSKKSMKWLSCLQRSDPKLHRYLLAVALRHLVSIHI